MRNLFSNDAKFQNELQNVIDNLKKAVAYEENTRKWIKDIHTP